ncbi:MAG: ribonuclease III domain-containing protein, partial [Alphaproteobacteria bacterium]
MAKPPGRSPAALAVRLGHDFARCDLLAEALTHPSAASRRHHSYERLEFLGDRVLGLVVADMLIDAFPGEPEGDLALRHAALVRREALSAVAGEFGLGDHLRLAPGEAEAGIRDNAAIQADAMEAVIAALYLDGGLEAARRFIARYWARPMAEAT